MTPSLPAATRRPVGDEQAQPPTLRGATSQGPRRPERSGLVAGVGLGALVASCGVVAAGGSPAALLVVSLTSTTLVLRRWLTTALAFATAMSGGFAVLAVSMRLWPMTGVPVTWLLVLAAAAAAVALMLLWRCPPSATAVSGPDLALAAGLASFSVLQVAAVPLARWLSESPKLAWMMRNDSTWNLVSARFIVDDGGLDPASHRNPAPLANEVVALFIAPGRSTVDPNDLLTHDLLRTSEALLLLVGATSLLAGLLVASAIPSSRPWSRAVLAATATIIPWTWSFAGQVFVYGFWNSLPAAILLLAAWAAWTSSELFPVVSSGVVALVGIGFLAAWAPLVLVAGTIGTAVVAWRWRPHLELRGSALLAWLAPLLLLVLYGWFVTRADYAVASGKLAAQGSFPPYGEHLPPVFLLVPLGVLLLLSTWSSVRTDLIGAAVVGLAGAVGTFYLMAQREGSPAGPWGYYPQKFAWTVSLLAPLLVLLSVRSALVRRGLARAQRGSLVLGVTMLATVLLLQVPPYDPRPVTAVAYPIAHRTPDYRLSSMFPAVSIALPDRASALDPAVSALLNLEHPDSKVVVSRWFPDPGFNAFVNFWLLQLPVDEADEPPRDHAYWLDSNDPVGLCSVVADWGGGVVIHTRSSSLAREMETQCPRHGFEVRQH